MPDEYENHAWYGSAVVYGKQRPVSIDKQGIKGEEGVGNGEKEESNNCITYPK